MFPFLQLVYTASLPFTVHICQESGSVFSITTLQVIEVVIKCLLHLLFSCPGARACSTPGVTSHFSLFNFEDFTPLSTALSPWRFTHLHPPLQPTSHRLGSSACSEIVPKALLTSQVAAICCCPMVYRAFSPQEAVNLARYYLSS